MHELNEEQSLVVTREDLGTVRSLKHRGEEVQYRLPKEIDGRVTLRFRGRGKKAGEETGDLLLHVTVDRGRDLRAVLWVSESQARSGCEKRLVCGNNSHFINVPAGSRPGPLLRLEGQGPASRDWKIWRKKVRGDYLVSLRIYPDRVDAAVGAVEAMSADELFLEGWVYRRTDEILAALRDEQQTIPPFGAVQAADLMNESGWEGIATALVRHLGLGGAVVSFRASRSLSRPGQCATKIRTRYNMPWGKPEHTIYIHTSFLGDPFAVVAILAHELCHILEARHFGQGRMANLKGDALMEMERTVDLLVFMHGLGEFQMRVARQSRMTLGYFNQDLFERMQVIWLRKQKEFEQARNAARERERNNPEFIQRMKKARS